MQTAESYPITAHLRNQLQAALAEDVGAGDITARSLFTPDTTARAVIRSRQPGVLCGVDVAETLFLLADGSLEVSKRARDGAVLDAGAEILHVQGRVIPMLSVERTALNFLGRLSGIATLTRRLVDLCEGTGVRIRDTRKTTPLWRRLEKYAVRVGGGENHRMGLDDGVMVKDTHLDALGEPERIHDIVRQWKEQRLRVFFEARDLAEVERAVACGADTVMLDNQPMEELRECIARCKEAGVECEITGGVNEANIRALAELGPDTLSLGQLTHSAPNLDFSMKTQVC